MDRYNIDLVMLSRFGASDGGMETWAYNFIPLLLGFDKRISLKIYGIQEKGRQSNADEFLSVIKPGDRGRAQMVLFPCKKRKIPYFFQMFFQMRREAFSSCPDIVLGVGGVSELLMLRFVKKYNKSKKILWYRTIFFNEKSSMFPGIILPLLRWIECRLLKKIDVVVANGTDIANYYGKRGFRVTVIPNGVDMERWDIPFPSLQLPIKVAYIGRLAKVKGICEFIEVVRRVKGSLNAANFVFHVVGDGLYEKEVQGLADEGQLIYHGVVPNKELPAMIAEYDVCVALTWVSQTDGGGGTSNALLEQMAAGRVIVAWDNAIFRQLLNEHSGFLVEQGDVGAIVDVLANLAEDTVVAKSKAVVAKEVMMGYSLDAQLKKFSHFLL